MEMEKETEKEKEKEGGLVRLPEDVLLMVLALLDSPGDLAAVAASCHALRLAVRSDRVWLPRCHPWRSLVDLPRWRASVDSGAALFRLLRSFDHFIGVWKALELAPRGGILWILWDDLSLVACKIFCIEGELRTQCFFEVIGLRDGSFKLECLIPKHAYKLLDIPTNVPTDRVPINLRWLPEGNDSFYLEKLNSGKGLIPDSTIEPNAQTISASKTESSSQSIFYNLIQFGLLGMNGVSHGWVNREPLVMEPPSSVLWKRIPGSLYSRLIIQETGERREHTGIWGGVYGPHGVELINVSYTNEEIIGTKVLGDPHVPCGEISFKVKISSENTQISQELQAVVDLNALGKRFVVVKLYQGHGRIAGYQFQNPQWVPGQLLVEENGRIGFLWEDVNFIVPFIRVDPIYLSQAMVV